MPCPSAHLIAADEEVEAVIEHQRLANAAHFNVILAGGGNRHGVDLVGRHVFYSHSLYGSKHNSNDVNSARNQ